MKEWKKWKNEKMKKIVKKCLCWADNSNCVPSPDAKSAEPEPEAVFKLPEGFKGTVQDYQRYRCIAYTLKGQGEAWPSGKFVLTRSSKFV